MRSLGATEIPYPPALPPPTTKKPPLSSSAIEPRFARTWVRILGFSNATRFFGYGYAHQDCGSTSARAIRADLLFERYSQALGKELLNRVSESGTALPLSIAYGKTRPRPVSVSA